MASAGESSRCTFCLELHSNEHLRQVKLRAVEFVRDYLDPHLIKCKFESSSIRPSAFPVFLVNRICLTCIDNHVRDLAYRTNRAVILNSKFLDIDYISDSNELNLTLQYIDQNGVPSVRITSRFLLITTVEQVIDYLIQTFDLPVISKNLLLTLIQRANNETWKPVLYDRSTTLYQLDVRSDSYLRFEFGVEMKRNSS